MRRFSFWVVLCLSLAYSGVAIAQSLQNQQSQNRDQFNLQSKTPGLSQYSQKLPTTLAFSEPIDPETYIIGPGDQLTINIQTIEPQFFQLVVDPTGSLLIPNIGEVSLLSKNLKSAKQLITEKVKLVYKDAIVSTSLFMPRIIPVYLVGAVKNPGVYNIYYTSRVSDVLDNSQLSDLYSKPDTINLVSQGDTTTLDYSDYLYNGDLEQNPQLRQADIIYVKDANPGISVTGYVNSPGIYPYIPGFTYQDYIGMAGGERPEGNAERFLVTDSNFEEKPQSRTIQPGDHIYIPKSRTYMWVGQTSLLQIITSVASLVLTYIAATRTLN
ncbi:MAG TPA: polysaccharide biosynthesis/export family protein [Bacteroidales bacterium]|nr:polysaccharide biosynthesis/export family protein [Bacteroidales bacterium]